jgi:hypothetical protein
VGRLHNEELHDLYCSSDIIRVIKERRMRWAEHVARIGDRRGVIQGFGEETGRKEASWKVETRRKNNKTNLPVIG